MNSPLLHAVTLITDFGWQDAYVGQLKGRLLQGCRHILPVDLSHAIPPWDIAAAARCLYDSYQFFPSGTIHLIIVDPGVGSNRQLLAAAGQGHFFLCPDNGILTYLLKENRIEKAHGINAGPNSYHTPSHTFHGRDILAPAAAQLACGTCLDTIGPALGLHDLVRLAETGASSIGAPLSLEGQVLSVDHFGNIRTSFHPIRNNIDRAHLSALTIKAMVIDTQINTYAEAPLDTPCFLIDSGGYIEIAINQGDASRLIRCQPGDPVKLQLKASNTLLQVDDRL